MDTKDSEKEGEGTIEFATSKELKQTAHFGYDETKVFHTTLKKFKHGGKLVKKGSKIGVDLATRRQLHKEGKI